MQRALQEETLRLTREILRTYWSGDITELRTYAHPAIQWIGTRDQEYTHGIEEFLDYLGRKRAQIPKFDMEDEQFEAVWSDETACAVAGRYVLRKKSENEAEGRLIDRHRVTFIWEMSASGLKIIHIHMSSILYIQDSGDDFAQKAEKEAMQYMQKYFPDREIVPRVSFKDTKNTTYLLDFADIYYVEADRNYTVIHRADKGSDIRIRESLTKVMSRLSDDFFMISRSCAVNLFYAQRLDGTVLTMVEGTQLAVSNSKRQQLAEMMQRQFASDHSEN
ncbi:MAG: LytTR family transcriptional regulator [Eubacteriales bacterium]